MVGNAIPHSPWVHGEKTKDAALELIFLNMIYEKFSFEKDLILKALSSTLSYNAKMWLML
jgi:hypothetical protein